MKKILFPTDFSRRSKKALVEAIDFARVFDAKLIIYHNYHRPADNTTLGSAGLLAKKLLALEKEIDIEFQKLLNDNKLLSKIKHEFRKEIGFTTERIPATASKESIDLIIMATKGAKGLEELWGTKTDNIVERVDVPILVIPDNTTLTDMKKVGLVCDYSKDTDYDTLDFLIGILQGLKLDVDIVTLNRNEKVMTNEQKGYRMLVRKKLEAVPTSFHFAFYNNVDRGIIDYAKANDLGLIAILPKTYSFIEGLFHESLTHKMTFRSPIPLLILK